MPDQPGDSQDGPTRDKGRTAFWISIGAIAVSALAAAFAAWQVYVAKDTAERQLRAYVYAVPGNVFDITGDAKVQGYVWIVNGGQTFARHVQSVVGIDVYPPGAIPENFDALGATPEFGDFTLAPGGGASDRILRKTKEPLNRELGEPDKVVSEELAIVVFGRVTYTDIFGVTHQTTFCHMYLGEDRAWDNAGYPKQESRYCDKHNEAD